MKIYSDRRRDYDNHNILNQFAGKDVWVRANVSRYAFESGVDCYIRVNNIVDGIVTYNFVYASYVEQDDVISMSAEWESFVARTLNKVRECKVERIEVRKPFSIINTDELIEMLYNNCYRRS